MARNLDLSLYLKKQRKRLLFSRFRNSLRKVIAPFFVVFGVVDFFYRPDKALIWLGYRVGFLVFVYIAFELLKNGKIRRKHADHIAILTLCIACWAIDLMIAQSGGHESLYITGLLLVTVTGVETGKMDRNMGVITYGLSFTPAILTVLYTSYTTNNMAVGFVQSFFMLGMIFLSLVYRTTEENLQKVWNKAKINRQEELDKHRRAALLNKSFPPALRKAIENGEETIPQRRLISQGVVGFADIIGSTSMANKLGLERDWELKQEFFKIASRRALSAELVVLNFAGDGFLFLANYHDSTDWPLNVVSFFEGLLRDFEDLKKTQLFDYQSIETGVKIGVAKGRVILGLIGDENQMHFTAMGPEVNLASRLCDKATKSEMVVSGEVWKTIKNSLTGWETKCVEYSDIKGFSMQISTAHISRRLKSDKVAICPVCDKALTVFRNDDGFFDLRCPNENDLTHINFANKYTA